VDAASIEHSDLTISREVNGEMLVLDGRAELIHQLNPTATFVWQQAHSGSAAADIAAALAEQYDVDFETAQRDVAATLARLRELNLVTSD
jgi:Coenzyme PQQ synthesis protein D (PqqD)